MVNNHRIRERIQETLSVYEGDSNLKLYENAFGHVFKFKMSKRGGEARVSKMICLDHRGKALLQRSVYHVTEGGAVIDFPVRINGREIEFMFGMVRDPEGLEITGFYINYSEAPELEEDCLALELCHKKGGPIWT